MSSIDERVVQMKFDNSQFQKGVADTNNSLASLKQGLNLSGAAAGLNELQSAGNRFSLAGMAAGVDTIASKFSALGIMGVTALVNISNQAVNAGINLVKSLTIAPIADGFSDYNAKLTSVQTIMNATGASIETVSGYFGELDTYADKTIYNLKDMTGAFAKFTNAGIGMDKSVPAIKGIANMVALAGQDAGAASIAMYNLSQSMAGGFLTTTDYKSLNLANVATKEWKDQMIAGAVAAGTLKKGTDGMYTIKGAKGAYTDAALFNDALKEGWATTEVMVDVLGDYGDTSTEIGKKAQAAAQDVKSWGMMMETLSAGVGTGWTDTFEILIGNITEAKAIFTPLTATIGGFLDEMSAARNEPLKEWKELGGRAILIETVQSAFKSLMAILGPIKDAFVEIFPPTTGKDLMHITTAIRDFVASLTPSFAVIDGVKRTAKGFFALLDIGKMIIMGVASVIGRLIGPVTGAGIGFLGITAKIGDFLVEVRNAMKYGTGLTSFFDNLGTAIGGAINGIKAAVKWIGDLFKGFEKVDTSAATAAVDNVTKRVDNLKEAGSGLKDIWRGFADMVKHVFDFFAPLGQKIADTAGKIGTGIADAMKGVNFNTVLDGINTGLFAGLVLLIRKFFKGGFKDAEEGKGLLATIKESIGGVTDTLGAMQTTLKAGTLILIAGAVALLTASILILSTIDSGKLMSSLAAIGALMGQLMVAMFILDKISSIGGAIKITILAAAMTLFAIAIGLLALSMKVMATMSWEEILKGLVGVVALLFAIAGALKLMSGVKGNLIAAGVGMMFIAVAIKILASAVKDFSDMDWQKMMQGLIAVGMVLGGLALFTRLAKVNKGAMGQAAGLILLGIAIKILASAVGDFAGMDWQKMMQGLIAMGMVLAALAVFSRVVNPSQMVSMGISMVIVGGALKIIASAIQDMGGMDVKTLIKGLGALALTLAAIGIFSRIVNPAQMITMGASMILIGVALKLLAEAFKVMGGMSWDEIGRGMVVLAGSLAILAGAMYLMEFALPGAAAMLVMAAALAVFVPVLQSLGKMSWDQIGTGLGALAASLGILAGAGIVLGILSPLFALLGVALILLGAGALLAGAGLLAFSIGFTALAVAGAAGAASLIAIISGLLGLIPMAFTQIGLGILAFAAVIANGAPAMIGAFVAVLTALLTAITTVIPLIVNVFVVLITALVNAIVTMTPLFLNALTVILMGLLNVIVTLTPAVINTMVFLITSLVNAIVGMVVFFVDAGMRLILGIINGIASRIGQIIDAGANLIVQFLNGIGRNIPKIVQAGVDLILDFVNGLANGIRNNQKRMEEAGGNLASAIIDGMTSGIRNGANAVIEAAKNMAKNAFEAAKNFLQINSPSKIFRTLGASTGEGFVQGMDRYGNKVGASAAGMGAIALESLKDTMSGISSIVASDIDSNPVIRPVLDLTDIQNNAGRIGSLLKSPALTVDGSYAKAASLIERERANREAFSDSSDTTNGTTGDQYVFNQTINSPKAVSAADTYRGTKNIISIAKDTKKGAPTK